jgi:hypothetical protein
MRAFGGSRALLYAYAQMASTLAAMPTLKTLDEVAKLRIPVKGRGVVKVSRRLLQQWLTAGKLKRWHIEGDRRRFVDMDEVHKLLEPRPIPPKS